MRLCILGTPDHTTSAVSTLCRTAMALTAGTFQEFRLDDEASTHSFLSAELGENILITSVFPRPALLTWLRNNDVMTVISAPDIRVSYSHAEPAMRALTGFFSVYLSLSLASLAAASALPRRLLVTGHRLDEELAALAHKVFHGGPEPSQEEWATARMSVISAFDAAASRAKGDDFAGHQDLSFQATTQACEGLLAHVRHGTPATASWPVSLYLDDISNSRPATDETEMTGPERCLFYGPYLHLPVGRWEADLTLELSGRRGPTVLQADVFCDGYGINEHIVRMQPVFPENGRFNVSFTFDVDDAFKPLQIRLGTKGGEIEGRLRFGGVKLRQAMAA
jgi:hypothetical protein